jgi:riboflavin synthase
MFTGIIEDIGQLLQQRHRQDGLALRIGSRLPAEGVRLGDSIAVNGACLTVTAFDPASFEVDVSHETLASTTLGGLRPGARLHLERALALGDRLGGHLVSGHVDGIGELETRRPQGANLDLVFSAPPEVAAFLVSKGSVAVDGVSLTVNEPGRDRFRVTLVPHTLGQTLLGERRVGDKVNLESDLLGKYVKRFVQGLGSSDSESGGGLDEAFLARHGFVDKDRGGSSGT